MFLLYVCWYTNHLNFVSSKWDCIPHYDFVIHMSLFQSLDYDRCINDPYLEVLETMDNKVSPLLLSWDWVGLITVSFSVLNAPVNTLVSWPFHPFREILAFIPWTFVLPTRVPTGQAPSSSLFLHYKTLSVSDITFAIFAAHVKLTQNGWPGMCFFHAANITL